MESFDVIVRIGRPKNNYIAFAFWEVKVNVGKRNINKELLINIINYDFGLRFVNRSILSDTIPAILSNTFHCPIIQLS